MTTNDRLYGKFHVERTDGRDRPGGDKYGAAYFVLDYVHDPYARTALAAYARACEGELPGLAADLRRQLNLCPRCRREPMADGYFTCEQCAFTPIPDGEE